MKKTILLLLASIIFTSTACATGNSSINKTAKGELSVKLKIQITNDKSESHGLTATLYDNSSARALVELLQKGNVTLGMRDYSNFEKVGDLPVSLPRNDAPTDTDAGDLILYLGKSFAIYYDKNNWNFTPLGKVDGVNKAELKKILGNGNVTAVLSITE